MEQAVYSKRQTAIGVGVFYFCIGLCFASWASRIPDIKDNLHLSEGQLGTILLGIPAGQLVTMPVSGRLVTRFGSRAVLMLGLALYAISLSNLGLATTGWQLALALFAFGICGNLCNISVNTQAIGVEKMYGKPIMPMFHGAWSIAGFIGALIGLAMMAFHLPPYSHFWIVAGVALIAVLSANKYIIKSWEKAYEKKPLFSKPDGVLIQLGIICFCCMACEGAMFDWSGVYFKEVVHAKGGFITMGYASFMIMMATGRFTGGKIIERIGKRKMLQISGLLITSGLLISILFPYIATATLGFLTVGFGVSCVVPTLYSTAGKVTKGPPGIALASVSSIGFLGFLMGPPLIGYIAQLTNLRFSFAAIALLGIGIAFMVGKIKAMD